MQAGIDVASVWQKGAGSRVVSIDRLGWSDPERVLLEKIWQNPHPDRVIQRVDFMIGSTPAAVFLVALTAE